jgi:hypothetical protein
MSILNLHCRNPPLADLDLIGPASHCHRAAASIILKHKAKRRTCEVVDAQCSSLVCSAETIHARSFATESSFSTLPLTKLNPSTSLVASSPYQGCYLPTTANRYSIVKSHWKQHFFQVEFGEELSSFSSDHRQHEQSLRLWR